MPAPNIEAVATIVEQWTQEVFDDIQDNARTDFKSKSNALAQSASVLEKNRIARRITYQILIDEHYQFIDQGVKGTDSTYLQSKSSRFQFKNKFVGRKMKNAISRWIKNAGVAKFSKKAGESRSQQLRSVAQQKDALAWAIAYGIKKKGIKATRFFSRAINPEKVKQLEERVSEAMGKKINLDMEGLFGVK